MRKQSVAELVEAENPYLSWNVTLPERVDPERIMVNMSCVEALGKVSGLGHINFGEYQGQRELSENVSVAGVSNGMATAGLAGTVSKATKPKINLEHGSQLAHDYQSPTANLLINRAALVDNVIGRKERTGNDTRAWAAELDIAYRGAVLRAARQNLLCKFDDLFLGDAVFMPEFIASPSTMSAFFAGVFYAASMASSLAHNKRETGGFHLNKKRWSISPTPHMQPDRLALAAMGSGFRAIGYRK